ncbi:hypothetical protein KC19_9G086100 [Ceratodon purpureus]|uniref:Uncharacterized protein n=1 Tax=Ceratodon purpureus TaxID=3225 RepID=A0A8T0GVK6_CERPU|nr:hypothetical protein KC19_9G086100 [Ceratodon purpureus]
MEKSAYAMLALVTFACFALTVSATTEQEAFTNAQEKTYGPSPAYDPVPEVPPSPPATPACPPPPAASPGSCSFWSKKKPSSLPDLLSFITPILDIFSSGAGSDAITAITSIFGSKTTLHQGLTSTRPDAYGELLRQGSAAVLNSYTSAQYPFTTFQVKASFRNALVSQQAAADMASKFENANLIYGARN